jgi:curved DNA-binding protein CbpA
MPEQNHYAVLGVQPSATQEQIRTQYRLLVKRYHPDLHPGDMAAEEMMGQVNQAYDVLGDPGERRQYDNDLRIAAESESVAGPQSWGQPSSRPGPQATQGGGQQSSWNPQWGAATDPRERQAEAEAMWEAMRARSRGTSIFGDIWADVPTGTGTQTPAGVVGGLASFGRVLGLILRIVFGILFVVLRLLNTRLDDRNDFF